jgi:hypothetical protein
MTPLHNHNLYKFKKQLFFSETFFKRDRHKFIVQQSIKGKKKAQALPAKKYSSHETTLRFLVSLILQNQTTIAFPYI